MPDEPFAVIAGVVSIHGNPVVFVSVVFRPDHRMELALPLGAAEYAATCSTSPPNTSPFNSATLLSTGWGSWVKTTGIHCRPVCWARTPFARNLESYPRPKQNVAAITPASVAVPKQLRFAQHGRALRQL